eukprot:TRINITY_DN7347_c0_g1_i1.p1 TRINITY_DN7347_c0_g1~~TRINITY_DN7347_c0_g1_i1.p1  ORF type:complete len:373 (+),score=21.83 TRINITY_DN7347_c0_g1_i1:117-1121(+)
MSFAQEYSTALSNLKTLSDFVIADQEIRQKNWKQVLQTFLSLNLSAQALSLSFSQNDTLEDVTTASLPYCLLSFYIAEILKSTVETDPQQRSLHLQQAVGYFQHFLDGIGQLQLLGKVADKLYDRETGVQLPKSLSEKRNIKVQAFKRRREISEQLESSGFNETEWILEGGSEQSIDEEHRRSCWLLKIEHCVLDSIDNISCIERELQMLDIAKDRVADASGSALQQSQSQSVSSSIQQITPAVDGTTRQSIQQQVFQPFHILPSMTPEQYAEIEIMKMREREVSERQFSTQQLLKHSSIEEQEEAELQKARQWDDFKDDNPRGWGNSQLKPCA